MPPNPQHPAEARAFDSLAEAGPAHRAFLRGRWFTAGEAAAERLLVARRENGQPIAAFPLQRRRKGPLVVREVGGCYWPFRGIPLAPETTVEDLACALGRHGAQLGRVWRLGPVEAGDPAVEDLKDAAQRAGWRPLIRPLGTLFELDLGELTRGGEWPSSKTLRKNRWRKRRLEEEGGTLRTEFFTGADWTSAQRDAMAEIEVRSWLGSLADGGDTKFRNARMRRYWEELCDDPALAKMLFGSLMWIGETPAAFTFGVQAGDTRYYIANNFDQRFTSFGPGRVSLYDDFEQAVARGVKRIGWGLGDAGYKSEMGARPGPEMHDLLFVRGRLAAGLLAPLWGKPA